MGGVGRGRDRAANGIASSGSLVALNGGAERGALLTHPRPSAATSGTMGSPGEPYGMSPNGERPWKWGLATTTKKGMTRAHMGRGALLPTLRNVKVTPAPTSHGSVKDHPKYV